MFIISLTQWRCDADLLSGFIGASLGLRGVVKKSDVEKIDGGRLHSSPP